VAASCGPVAGARATHRSGPAAVGGRLAAIGDGVETGDVAGPNAIGDTCVGPRRRTRIDARNDGLAVANAGALFGTAMGIEPRLASRIRIKREAAA
jgi:hypothetical protein